jgi:hypothetical protein
MLPALYGEGKHVTLEAAEKIESDEVLVAQALCL